MGGTPEEVPPAVRCAAGPAEPGGSEVHAAHAAVAAAVARAAFSGLSAMTASVVRNSAAMDAASAAPSG